MKLMTTITGEHQALPEDMPKNELFCSVHVVAGVKILRYFPTLSNTSICEIPTFLIKT